jgi:hypothetical protein
MFQICWIESPLPQPCHSTMFVHFPTKAMFQSKKGNLIVQLSRSTTRNCIQVLITFQAASLYCLAWTNSRATCRAISPSSCTAASTPTSGSRRRTQSSVLAVALVGSPVVWSRAGIVLVLSASSADWSCTAIVTETWLNGVCEEGSKMARRTECLHWRHAVA